MKGVENTLPRYLYRHRLLLILALGTISFFLIMKWSNRGEWETFVSSEEYEGNEFTSDFPLFRISRPANWDRHIYYGGDSRGYDDLWVILEDGVLVLPESNWLWIFWRRIEQPTFADILQWSQVLIEQHEGSNASTLRQINVGAAGNRYRAWQHTYRSGRSLNMITATYIPTENSLFAIEFAGDNDVSVVFERMMESFYVIQEASN